MWVGRAGPWGAKIQMDQVTAEYKEGGFKTGAQKKVCHKTRWLFLITDALADRIPN